MVTLYMFIICYTVPSNYKARITGEFLLDTSSWWATKRHSADRMWSVGRSFPTPVLDYY